MQDSERYRDNSRMKEPKHTVFIPSCPLPGMTVHFKQTKFAEAMKFYTIFIPGNSKVFRVHGYGWKSLRLGVTVVDIGGSDGHVSIPWKLSKQQQSKLLSTSAVIDQLRFEPTRLLCRHRL